jgi:hypothetical protein
MFKVEAGGRATEIMQSRKSYPLRDRDCGVTSRRTETKNAINTTTTALLLDDIDAVDHGAPYV